MQSAGNIVVNGRSPTCEDNMTACRPHTGESKWKMFLENTSSSDGNGKLSSFSVDLKFACYWRSRTICEPMSQAIRASLRKNIKFYEIAST